MRLSRIAKRALALMAATAVAGCAQTGGIDAPRQAAAPKSASVPTAQRPNVLLILVDDLKPTLRSFGDRTAISPNIDRLVARGTRFEHAYANQAVCAPSRINLMTSRRSTSTGIYNFGQNLRDYMPDAVTLPQAFMRAGYQAESMGKVYHVGHGTQGDDASWSAPPIKDYVIEYVDPANAGKSTREEALFNEIPVPADQDIFKYASTLTRGAAWESPDVADDAYADGRTANRAAKRLAELKSSASPFFLAVGFARPHLPFSVPKRYWDLYDPAKLPMPKFEQLPEGAPVFAGKVGGEIIAYEPVPEKVAGKDYPEALKRKLIHGYYAGVSYVDAQIGKVLDALEREGLADNTIVVLWGDHGFHLGDHGIWTKHTNFEQAVHLPLIFAGPGTGRPGSAPGQIAETVDVYPTLVKLAGITLPARTQPIDGADLTPVLHDPAKRVRPYAYHAFNRPGRIGQAIRTERYRLVRWTQEASGARAYELYDMQADPGETRNMADALPKVRAELEAYLDAQPKPVPVALKAQRAAQGRN
ncbi:sulfatase [Sphingomonas sp. BT-65]|uniref:sulfatase n=1 Tax=Sphingomonas sp. BT-65 TaxID=2989821 RepID=UPI002235DEE4|nr:sulfatase [Sphingomonas sp. BT-65]MCW4463848.1 sulfatase [Sphingomonas sp. BT-65]